LNSTTPSMNLNTPPSFNVSQVPTAQYEPGGFWRRFAAVMVDGIIFGVAQAVLTLPIQLLLGGSMSGAILGVVFSYAVSFALIWFYYGYFYSKKGATPGKSLMGLKVLRSDTGENMSQLGAFGRETVGKFCSIILLGIGFIMAAFNSEKRALHDMMFTTRVVRVKGN
jgi:uncharacterized RDD family membrane protein YckC